MAVLRTWVESFCFILQILTQVLFYTSPGVDYAFLFSNSAHYFSSPWVYYSVVTILLYTGAWIIGLVLFYTIYKINSPIINYYKVNKAQWPWLTEKKEEYLALVKRAVDEFVGNQIGIVLFTFGIYYFLDGNTPFEFLDGVGVSTLPSKWENFWKLMVGFLIFDCIFYWTHRFEHVWLYDYHKVHHMFHTPSAITGTFGHSIDGYLGIIAPAFIPALGLKMHLFTFWQFMMILTLHSVVEHCGLELPYNPLNLIPLSFGVVKAHDFHHTHNVGNFSLLWNHWDWICGTGEAYKKYLIENNSLNEPKYN